MDIYQHFRKEEQPFIDQALSWKERVEQTFQPKLTDFLDPREQQLVEMLVGLNNPELKLDKHGGGSETERKRMVIAPFYEEITDDSFELTLLQATYPAKFITIEHRDVMGAFLSMGIKRRKLGDIYAADGLIQIVLADEISSYVTANLTGIKKAAVTFEEKPFAFLKKSKKDGWKQTKRFRL